MTTTDSNGVVFLEETDLVSPLHTIINVLQAGTSAAVEGSRRGPLPAANTTERDAWLTAYGSSAASPLWVDVAGSLYRHAGSGWVYVTGTPVTTTPTYTSPFGAPGSTAPGNTYTALTLNKEGLSIRLNSGTVLNTTTVTGGAYAQFSNALQIPAGYIPARRIYIPMMYGVDGTGLWAGQVIVMPTGQCTVQITQAIPSVPANSLQIHLSSARWEAAS